MKIAFIGKVIFEDSREERGDKPLDFSELVDSKGEKFELEFTLPIESNGQPTLNIRRTK